MSAIYKRVALCNPVNQKKVGVVSEILPTSEKARRGRSRAGTEAKWCKLIVLT